MIDAIAEAMFRFKRCELSGAGRGFGKYQPFTHTRCSRILRDRYGISEFAVHSICYLAELAGEDLQGNLDARIIDDNVQP